MKDVIEVEIGAPQREVAALFANPENTISWMDDLARYEPVSGEPGTPGSQYRLVPKHGDMVFLATVVSSDLPKEARLEMDAADVSVSVRSRFVALSPHLTRLISEEEFSFKGLLRRVFSVFARGAIRSAHRRHIYAFKEFAERHLQPG
jgi:hypothetical protein